MIIFITDYECSKHRFTLQYNYCMFLAKDMKLDIMIKLLTCLYEFVLTLLCIHQQGHGTSVSPANALKNEK
jgi:hypothetical protein